MNNRNLLYAIEDYWQPILLGLLVTAALGGLLWYRLASLPGGVTATEQIYLDHLINKDIGGRSLLDNPVNLPYTLALYLLEKLGIASLFILRSLSAFIGIVVAISFYTLLKKWHTERIAILGTILLVASSWFLHIARYGSPEILQALLIVFFFAGIWLQHSRHRTPLLAILVLSGGLLLYVPGMIWFVILGGIWQRKRIAGEVEGVPPGMLFLYSLITLAVVAPLGWAIFNDLEVFKQILGFPASLPSPQDFITNIINIPLQLFWSGVTQPHLGIQGLPLLDIFSMAMFIIGAYWYGQRFQLDRTMVIIVVFLLSSLLIGLGGPVTTTILLPFVYLVIATGITYMLSTWFEVFPRNPIARPLGTMLLTLAVLLTTFYHMNRYFVAWPHTPATQQVYHQPR